MLKTKLFTAFLSFGDSAYDNVSEDVYISFGAVTKYAINQNPPSASVQYIFDIVIKKNISNYGLRYSLVLNFPVSLHNTTRQSSYTL